MPTSSTPTRLSRTVIYQNRWVNLYVDRVQFPNGHVIDQHHLLDFDRESVMVIARDSAGRYLMVQVCRYPTGRTEWEFPAGSIEPGEDVLAAGARELLEESGYHSSEPGRLYTYHPMNGIANQVFHVTRCQVTQDTGRYDTDEISGVAWFTAQEIMGMIRSGEMQDGYTLTAFLLDLHL